MATGENGKIAVLMGVKVMCCGGLLLAATGVLTGLGAWLTEEGLAWLGASGLIMATGLIVWRRRRHGALARSGRPLTGAGNVSPRNLP